MPKRVDEFFSNCSSIEISLSNEKRYDLSSDVNTFSHFTCIYKRAYFIFILLTSPDFLAGKPQQRRPITEVP